MFDMETFGPEWEEVLKIIEAEWEIDLEDEEGFLED